MDDIDELEKIAAQTDWHPGRSKPHGGQKRGKVSKANKGTLRSRLRRSQAASLSMRRRREK